MPQMKSGLTIGFSESLSFTLITFRIEKVPLDHSWTAIFYIESGLTNLQIR